MLRRLCAVGVLVIVSAFLFMACGDSEEPSDTSETAPAGPTEDVGQGNDDGAGDDNNGNNGNNGDNSDADELRAAVERFIDATFTATYEVTTTDTTAPQTMTMYRDGNERFRFDMAGVVDGQPFEGSFITTTDSSLICSTGDEFAGLPGVDPNAEGVCFENSFGTEGNPFADVEDFLGDFESGQITVLSKENRQIAGQDATCYETKDAQEEVSTACLGDDGILLEAVSGTGADAFTMTATEVSAEVSASDFEPPYEVVELPTLGE